MTMLDGEIRFGTGTAMVLVAWGTALGLLLASWLTDEWELGFAAVSCSGLGAALMVIRDNCRTRRVVRAVAREAPAVRSLRD